MLTIATTFEVDDRTAGKPFTAELTRKLWLESATTLVVEVTRAGVLGGSASTTRAIYRNRQSVEPTARFALERPRWSARLDMRRGFVRRRWTLRLTATPDALIARPRAR